MGDRLAFGLTLAAAVFLAGAAYVGATMPERPVRTKYSLEVETETTENAVTVRGETNLPDGARLLVFVDRLYRLKGRDTWSAARIGQTQAIVENGTWEAEVPVMEEAWVRDVAAKVDARTIDPVRAIHETLRATVVFSSFTAQPAHVQDAMGPNFERLADSEQALWAGEFWLLRQQDTVRRPMRLELEKRLLPTAG